MSQLLGMIDEKLSETSRQRDRAEVKGFSMYLAWYGLGLGTVILAVIF
jgi:hypothetical protein